MRGEGGEFPESMEDFTEGGRFLENFGRFPDSLGYMLLKHMCSAVQSVFTDEIAFQDWFCTFELRKKSEVSILCISNQSS